MSRRSTKVAATAIAVLTGLHPARAIVTTDGSLGPRSTFTGTNVLLPASLGRQKGGNLFHSFDRFDVPSGGRVTFTGPAGTKNVLARVTGGQNSRINGTLGSQINGANLYLINPAGITFGAGSHLDVSGTFTATTADVIRLADTTAFAVDKSGDGVLTGTQPVAFGFLSARPGAIGLSHTILLAPAARLVGSNIAIDHATMTCPAGHISVAAVRSGQVLIDARTGDLSPAAGTIAAEVKLTSGMLLTDGTGGGRLDLFAADLATDAASDLSATTRGGRAGRGMRLTLTGTLSESGGTIHASTSAAGAAGGLVVHADTVALTKNAYLYADSFGAGTAGAVKIAARRLSLSGGGQISSDAYAAGPGGTVDVVARSVSLIDGGEIASESRGAGTAGSVRVRTGHLAVDGAGDADITTGLSVNADAGGTGATGRGGTIQVRADRLSLANAGQIIVDAYGPGAGGAVSVVANRMSIDGHGNGDVFTGISSDADAGGNAATGPGGRVTVTAKSLLLVHGGTIECDADGPGNAGVATVSAGTMTIDGANDDAIVTGVTSDADPAELGATGHGGQVRVTAGSLRLRDTGVISADAFGPGDGGRVAVTAQHLLVDGGGNTKSFTGIGSDADADRIGATGAAGGVTVAAGAITILDSGGISSDTNGPGSAGQVTINTRRLSIDGAGRSGLFTGVSSNADAATAGPSGPAGDVTVTARMVTVARGGKISSTTFGPGHAGRVAVTAGDLTLHSGGEVSSSTFGAGHAGSVVVAATNVAIDGQTRKASFTGITSQTNPGAQGDAGDVSLDAGRLMLFGGGRVASDSFGPGAAGDIRVHAGDLSIDGNGNRAGPTSISSASDANGTGATGPAGDVSVVAGRLTLRDTASIDSDTFGSGNAGKVTVSADAMTIIGTRRGRIGTGVSSQANPASAGNAGTVAVTAKTLALSQGGTISSSTDGTGVGGTVHVRAGDLRADGNGIEGLFTGVTTAANGNGPAGDTTVVADTMSLVDGAQIASSTFGRGAAGSVLVKAARVAIDGTDAAAPLTGVFSQALKTAGGAAGSVRILGRTVDIENTGQVAAESFGPGPAGAVAIAGDDVRLAGQALVSVSSVGARAGDVTIRATDAIRSTASTVSSASASGDGGDILLHAGRLIALDHSKVTAQAGRNGARLALDPLLVVLNDSVLNGLAGNARLGFTPVRVSIDTGAVLIKSQDSTILNDNPVLPPDVDLAGAILHFVVPAFGGQTTLADGCEMQMRKKNLSSFVGQERLGLPPVPGQGVLSPPLSR